MATYFMFGRYSPRALKAVSAQRSEEAIALIRKYGSEYKAACVARCHLSNRPAVSVEVFDRVMA
jgi:hypothetical protein